MAVSSVNEEEDEEEDEGSGWLQPRGVAALLQRCCSYPPRPALSVPTPSLLSSEEGSEGEDAVRCVGGMRVMTFLVRVTQRTKSV